MAKYKFSELVNINTLKEMSENLFEASGIPLGIIDVDGNICVQTGWQDICTKFHRVHAHTCSRCLASDRYIHGNLSNESYIEYKCLNNMWDVAMPLVIAGEHLATIFLGQFFYEDEVIDIEIFKKQADQFGFDKVAYLDALSRVPRLSRKKVNHIIKYYIGLITTLVDSGVTQLVNKNSQEELAINQKYLDTIFNSVSESIVIHGFDGKIKDVNLTAQSMFGYKSEELINMNITDIISVNSPIKGVSLFEMLERARYSNPLSLECICKNQDGMEFWVDVNLSVVKLGCMEELIATVRDITDRKLNQLARHKEAEEMEKLRTEFFANISHELRTPLNIIYGALQIMERELQNQETPICREKLKKNLSIEKQNCYRLLRLINNLIDSTKLELGYYELNMTNGNIVSIIEEIALSVADHINENNLTLTFDTDVEEKYIACDQDKLERILLNLLSNAVKFTPDGGNIFVNIHDGNEYITITVEDTGIGIPYHKLDVIFDRFRQVDKSLARNFEGSGIGLSLVKTLVEMHSGTIEVESVFGLGSKFSVKLPVLVIGANSAIEQDKNEGAVKNCIERIKIEFSDIYN